MTVTLLDRAPLRLGEGPRWGCRAPARLLVDVLSGRIPRWDHFRTRHRRRRPGVAAAPFALEAPAIGA